MSTQFINATQQDKGRNSGIIGQIRSHTARKQHARRRTSQLHNPYLNRGNINTGGSDLHQPLLTPFYLNSFRSHSLTNPTRVSHYRDIRRCVESVLDEDATLSQYHPSLRRTVVSILSSPHHNLTKSRSPIFEAFSRSSVVVNADINNILEYYVSFAIAGAYRVETLALEQSPRQHRHFALIREALGEGLSDDALLFAILASTTARMSHMVPNGAYYGKLTDRFMYFAAKRLRQLLSSERYGGLNGQVLVKAIFHICTAEWYRGNFATIAVHREILKQLTTKHLIDRGTGFTRDMIGVYDTFMSIETGQSPSFPLTWQPLMLSEEIQNQVRTRLMVLIQHEKAQQPVWWRFNSRQFLTEEDKVLGRSRPFLKPPAPDQNEYGKMVEDLAVDTARKGQGRGFSAAAKAGIFSPGVTELIENHLVPWQEVSIVLHMTGFRDVEEAEWVCKMGIAILHRLLVIAGAPHEGTTRRETATLIALIMCMSNIASPLAWRSIEGSLDKLKMVLLSMEASMSFREVYCPSLVEAELMLWILNIGMEVAMGIAKEEGEWYASRAVKVARSLRLTTFSQMFELMGKFFLAVITQQTCMQDLLCRIGLDTTETVVLEYGS